MDSENLPASILNDTLRATRALKIALGALQAIAESRTLEGTFAHDALRRINTVMVPDKRQFALMPDTQAARDSLMDEERAR